MLKEYGQLIGAICFLACNALSAYAGYWASDTSWSQRWAERDALDAVAAQRAAEDALTKQQNILQELENAYKTSEALTAKIDAAERRSNDLSKQLRDAIEARKRLLQANNTGVIATRANAATDALVLAELFGRAEQRATNLAGYADRHRTALIACRAEYDIIRQELNK